MVGTADRSVREKQVVALLLAAPDARATIAKECGAFAVQTHETATDLLATVRDRDVCAVVVDVLDSAGRPMSATVAAVRAVEPGVPILGYCRLSPIASVAIPDFVRAGATGLLFKGVDDVGFVLRSAFRSARRSAVEARIYQELAPALPATIRPLLRYAATHTGDSVSVAEAAAALGVDRKTLLNRLQTVGGMGPREFINWVRLAVAIGILETGGRSAEQVSLELGFPSGTAFRNMLMRYTSMTTTELRDAGGLTELLRRLLRLVTHVTPRDNESEQNDLDLSSMRLRA